MRYSEIPWARVLAEGVVIVLSILLAFAIDAWWEGRGDVELERSYLEGMEADFEEAHQELQRLLPIHRDKTAALSKLNRALSAGEGAYHADSVISWSHLLWTVDPYDPAMPTYENLLESGGPGVLRSAELRDALRQYESVLDTNRDWDDYLVRFDGDLMVDLLASRLPYFARVFEDEVSDSDPQPDFDALARDMTFRNVIAIRFAGERTLVERRERLDESLVLVQRVLQLELGR